MKQHDAVIETIKNLGGIATLAQLNQEVFKIKDCSWKTKTPFATIRRIVQQRPEIYKIRPGLYGLVSHKKINEQRGISIETEKNKNSKEIQEFNHSYYQGIILQIGKFKGLETIVPFQDKNKTFLNKKLKDFCSLDSFPSFSFEKIVHRSSTIDVIWFNERSMPHSFFEIEHSTDIQNSLLKFNDLQDFYVRMIIVADKKRKAEYESKIKYSSFKEIIQRVIFLDYESLSKQYEYQIQQSQFSFLI